MNDEIEAANDETKPANDETATLNDETERQPRPKQNEKQDRPREAALFPFLFS